MDVETLAQARPNRRRSSLRLRWVALLAGAVLLGAQTARPEVPSEADVEAAYLYNFGKLLRLPTVPTGPARTTFDICVVGRDDLGQTLDKLTANERSDSLPERAIRVKDAASARSCAIVFLSSSEAPRLDRDLSALADAPVLTVSDMPQFLDRGGMIQFLVANQRVRFAVNLQAVERCSLSLSSQLLKVAVSVNGKPGGGTP
jgi:hypothetical protein